MHRPTTKMPTTTPRKPMSRSTVGVKALREKIRQQSELLVRMELKNVEHGKINRELAIENEMLRTLTKFAPDAQAEALATIAKEAMKSRDDITAEYRRLVQASQRLVLNLRMIPPDKLNPITTDALVALEMKVGN